MKVYAWKRASALFIVGFSLTAQCKWLYGEPGIRSPHLWATDGRRKTPQSKRSAVSSEGQCSLPGTKMLKSLGELRGYIKSIKLVPLKKKKNKQHFTTDSPADLRCRSTF